MHTTDKDIHTCRYANTGIRTALSNVPLVSSEMTSVVTSVVTSAMISDVSIDPCDSLSTYLFLNRRLLCVDIVQVTNVILHQGLGGLGAVLVPIDL